MGGATSEFLLRLAAFASIRVIRGQLNGSSHCSTSDLSDTRSTLTTNTDRSVR